MMKEQFDSRYTDNEQLPRYFSLSFREDFQNDLATASVRVEMDGEQLGNTVDDNSFENDFYRYHDIFHYTFATLLGWSPCTRVLMKRKRKSNPIVDRVEEGARATITEEAISLIIFSEAKRKNFFTNGKRVSKTVLRIIKEMTAGFEVRVRSTEEWETAILKAYSVFRKLVANRGGQVDFDMVQKTVEFSPQ